MQPRIVEPETWNRAFDRYSVRACELHIFTCGGNVATLERARKSGKTINIRGALINYQSEGQQLLAAHWTWCLWVFVLVQHLIWSDSTCCPPECMNHAAHPSRQRLRLVTKQKHSLLENGGKTTTFDYCCLMFANQRRFERSSLGWDRSAR